MLSTATITAILFHHDNQGKSQHFTLQVILPKAVVVADNTGVNI